MWKGYSDFVLVRCMPWLCVIQALSNQNTLIGTTNPKYPGDTLP